MGKCMLSWFSYCGFLLPFCLSLFFCELDFFLRLALITFSTYAFIAIVSAYGLTTITRSAEPSCHSTYLETCVYLCTWVQSIVNASPYEGVFLSDHSFLSLRFFDLMLRQPSVSFVFFGVCMCVCVCLVDSHHNLGSIIASH